MRRIYEWKIVFLVQDCIQLGEHDVIMWLLLLHLWLDEFGGISWFVLIHQCVFCNDIADVWLSWLDTQESVTLLLNSPQQCWISFLDSPSCLLSYSGSSFHAKHRAYIDQWIGNCLNFDCMVFRMEVLNCRNSSFLAKTFGTGVSISGAFVVTLYKGPEILTYLSSPKLHYEYIGAVAAQSSWIIGGLFLAADCVVASAYIIVQV